MGSLRPTDLIEGVFIKHYHGSSDENRVGVGLISDPN